MKKVLILCTGNSCRSIIAEALINAFLDEVEAQSAGVKASGRVNFYAKKVLQKHNIWKNRYHSKTIESVINQRFDLVVSVCDNAKENCPIFPQPTPTIHIGFKDPDGEKYDMFVQTYRDIKAILLPKIEKQLNLK